MASPANLSLKQTIEGMPLTFNPDAAEGLNAVIQFNVGGSEAGDYYLTIANGACSFSEGAAKRPSLTIATPSDVWLKISRGEMSAALSEEKSLPAPTGRSTPALGTGLAGWR